MGVKRCLGEGAAAPAGGGGVVGRAQGVAARPVQQLEVTEEARRGEHLSNFRKRGRKKEIEMIEEVTVTVTKMDMTR